MHFSIQFSTQPKVLGKALLDFMVILLLSGCSTTQLHSTTQVLAINLESQSLQASGIAFITPTSATGQEEDKQALALAFTEALKRARPELRIVSLSETLSAINSAGFAKEYMQMFEDSRLSGIISRDILQKISRATNVRYLAQLKLGGFRQESKSRWDLLGLRIVETKTTFLRLYLQIWDGENGSVVWEGSEELTSANDSMHEDPVPFKMAVEQSAEKILARLP